MQNPGSFQLLAERFLRKLAFKTLPDATESLPLPNFVKNLTPSALTANFSSAIQNPAIIQLFAGRFLSLLVF